MAHVATMPSVSRPRVRTAFGFAYQLATTLALIAVLAIAALTVVVPKVAGAVPLTVLSNSMAPTMPVGSLAVVRPTMDTQAGDPARLDAAQIDAVNQVEGIGVGDVIVFAPKANDPRLVVHRVTGMAVSSDGRRTFTTKGDNNSSVDDPVHGHQVRAVVWYHLPLLGYVNDKVKDDARFEVAIAVAALGYVWAAALFIKAARRRPSSSPADADLAPAPRDTAETLTVGQP